MFGIYHRMRFFCYTIQEQLAALWQHRTGHLPDVVYDLCFIHHVSYLCCKDTTFPSNGQIFLRKSYNLTILQSYIGYMDV